MMQTAPAAVAVVCHGVELWLLRRANCPRVVTHGLYSATTTWFYYIYLYTVGYHPRLCSGHRDAVLSGYLAIIMHYAL